MKIMIIFLFIYLLFPSIFLGILNVSKRLIQQKIRQKMRIRTPIERKPSLNKVLNQSVAFVIKSDKRKTARIPNKFIVGGIYLIGLLVTVFFALNENYVPAVIGLFIPFISGIISFVMYAPIKQEQEVMIERLYNIKRDRMGLANKGAKRDEVDYSTEVRVTKWKDDNINPETIEFSIPTSFDPLNSQQFLEHFNVYFGDEATWVPDKSQGAGWDFKKFKLSLCQMPPLPERAMWSERYLREDEFAWSFFPLGLGSENGVKIYNEETERTEHVLGFDLAGEQPKLAKKNGLEIGSDIVMAPQVLISGGTGGGKALNVDTKVAVIKKDKPSGE